MHESAESRSAAVRAVLLRFYPHQYPWGESCALTVGLLLSFSEAAHDSAVMNMIYNRTVVKLRRKLILHVHAVHPATQLTYSTGQQIINM